MKTLCTLLAAALLAGCATPPHPTPSALSAEGVHRFSCSHTLAARDAFNKVELALAESYNDLPRVLKLRQPETGTFLVKALAAFSVGTFPAYEKHANYSLKIIVGETDVQMTFELDPITDIGIYSPREQVPKIRGKFELVAANVARSVGSEVVAR